MHQVHHLNRPIHQNGVSAQLTGKRQDLPNPGHITFRSIRKTEPHTSSRQQGDLPPHPRKTGELSVLRDVSHTQAPALMMDNDPRQATAIFPRLWNQIANPPRHTGRREKIVIFRIRLHMFIRLLMGVSDM